MEASAAPASSNTPLPPQVPLEELDTRGMPAPGPVLTILKKVSQLSANARLQIRLDNNPMQLYDLLQQRGFFLDVKQQPDGSVLGLVRHRDLSPPTH